MLKLLAYFLLTSLAWAQPFQSTMTSTVKQVDKANEGITPKVDCGPMRIGCATSMGLDVANRMSIGESGFSFASKNIQNHPTIVSFVAKKTEISGIKQVQVKSIQLEASAISSLRCQSSGLLTGGCRGPVDDVVVQLKTAYSGQSKGLYELNGARGKIANLVVTSQRIKDGPRDLLVKSEFDLILDGEVLKIKAEQKFKSEFNCIED